MDDFEIRDLQKRMEGVSFIVPSNKPEKYKYIQSLLPEINCEYFDGSNIKNWSHLWNLAFCSAKQNTIIFCQDKAKPKLQDVKKCLDLIDKGFGSVQMHCLGFTGFKKYLFTKIGFLDERFNGHGDFLLRHKYFNVAYYESLEVEYEQSPSSWGPENDFFFKKWKTPRFHSFEMDFDERVLEDETYEQYNQFLINQEEAFLPYKDSVILTGNTDLYNRKMVSPFIDHGRI